MQEWVHLPCTNNKNLFNIATHVDHRISIFIYYPHISQIEEKLRLPSIYYRPAANKELMKQLHRRNCCKFKAIRRLSGLYSKLSNLFISHGLLISHQTGASYCNNKINVKEWSIKIIAYNPLFDRGLMIHCHFSFSATIDQQHLGRH